MELGIIDWRCDTEGIDESPYFFPVGVGKVRVFMACPFE
jgi:hypothetical protein